MSTFRASHFGWKHLVVSFISQNVFGNVTYTIRHGLASGMRRKGGLGFLPIGSAETQETRFLRDLPLEGKVVYDVGAFEGVLTMFFARKARQVISYEPNPRNHSRCLENIRLNRLSNVQLMNRGVSDRPGTIELTYDPLTPGAGSGEAAIAGQIGSSVKRARLISIAVLPLDDDIAQSNLTPPDFVKIDIEGMELPALRGMQRTLQSRRPDLFIELHGATASEKRANALDVLRFLESFDYRMTDVEHSRSVTSKTLGDSLPHHLFCTSAAGTSPQIGVAP